MRKLQSIVGVVAAVCSFGLLAASASSATFLLAEWLLNGVAITSNDLVEVEGETLLEDLGAGNDILCSGIGVGWVGPNSLGWVSELLNLAKEVISSTPLVGLALLCEVHAGTCEASTPTVDVYPVGLPVELEIELLEQSGGPFFFALGFKHGGGKAGWEITNCLTFGISVTDECSSESGEFLAAGDAELTLNGTTLVGTVSEETTLLGGFKLSNCTVGGAEKGVLEGSGNFIVSGGGELTASSDGLIS